MQAVRGNNDHGKWAEALPHSLELELGDQRLYLVHQPQHLPSNLAERGLTLAICGHSHSPSIERRGTLLLINPGSAGPRRFNLPAGLTLLHLSAGQARAEWVDLLG